MPLSATIKRLNHNDSLAQLYLIVPCTLVSPSYNSRDFEYTLTALDSFKIGSSLKLPHYRNPEDYEYTLTALDF